MGEVHARLLAALSEKYTALSGENFPFKNTFWFVRKNTWLCRENTWKIHFWNIYSYIFLKNTLQNTLWFVRIAAFLEKYTFDMHLKSILLTRIHLKSSFWLYTLFSWKVPRLCRENSRGVANSWWHPKLGRASCFSQIQHIIVSSSPSTEAKSIVIWSISRLGETYIRAPVQAGWGFLPVFAQIQHTSVGEKECWIEM